MARVLVTGGTGVLGRQLVPRLLAAGHQVAVMSRRTDPPLPEGAVAVVGDVRDAAAVRLAVQDRDAVVHAATQVARSQAVEVGGARNVADACLALGAHVVYVSIVGVDRHRFRYYRAKRAAEQVFESTEGLAWSIQRATQFHDLIDRALAQPFFLRTRNLSFQVIDAGDVADVLVEAVDEGPSGMRPDIGGPAAIPIKEMASTRRRVVGKAARLVSVPALGFMRDFDDGLHLCPDRAVGTVTWEQWLEERARRA